MKKFKKNALEYPLTQAKVFCKCGNIITFKYNHFCICKNCGSKVYPSEKNKFKDIIGRKLKI